MIRAQAAHTSRLWVTITLLLAAVGAYAWYVSGQYGRLNDLNQRQLSNAGAELKTAIDTAVETATRFNRKRADWAENSSGPEPGICDFDRNQPFLDLPACASDLPPIPRDNEVPWRDVTVVQPYASPTLGIRVASADKRLELPFQFRSDRLLRELAFPDSFALIFIASAEGEILYQDAPERRRWLRHLRWGEQNFRDASADRPPTILIQNLQQLLGGDAETWSRLRSVTSRTGVEIGGTAHQLYLQPLVLEHGQRLGLVIGGAVPTSTIVRDALALNTYLVAVLVAILLLGGSALPFVKLWLLSPRERFTLRDLVWLHMSTGALLVLITCGALAMDGYVRWQAVADRGLKALAGDLERRFLSEVNAIRDEVGDLDARVRELPVLECNEWHAHTNWFAGASPDSGDLRQAVAWAPALSLRSWPRRDAHLRQVAWIRSDGWQILKITSDTLPGRTQVAQRVYFRAVQDGSLFQVRDSEGAFFFGADRSVSDGKFYTFLSMKSSMPPPRCQGANGMPDSVVVAASGHLLSLDQQPLPAGYGFALINREGRVLYHSDSRLSLRENLYEELSEGARARAMIYAGLDEPLKTRYRERPHRFYLHQLALTRAGEPTSAGFYLAVFRDASVEQALIGNVFVGGLLGPILLLLVIYAAVGAWGLVRAFRSKKAVSAEPGSQTSADSTPSCDRWSDRAIHHWSTWLWPHGGLTRVYAWQAVAFFGVLLLAWAIYINVPSLAGFLATPILAAAAGIGIFEALTRKAVKRATLSGRALFTYTVAIVLALACMLVVPSATVFRLALNHEFAKLILTERDWIAAQKGDTLRAAAVETRTENYGPARTAQVTAMRRRYFGCIPAPFDALDAHVPNVPSARQPAVVQARQAVVDGNPSTAPTNERSAAVCTPVSGSSASDIRSANLESIGMDAWIVDTVHPFGDLLPVGNDILARQQFQRREFTYSPDGTLLQPLRLSGAVFVGLVIMVGLLVYWIRWNTTHLFLADEECVHAAEEPAPKPPAPESADERWSGLGDEKRMVLLQISRERIANPRQRAAVTELLKAGVLRLNPDLRPSSTHFSDDFLKSKQQQLQAEIREWEEGELENQRSWHDTRKVLIACVVALALFLIVTQPAVQSGLIGIATAIAGALTAIMKLRDAISSWFPGSKTAS